MATRLRKNASAATSKAPTRCSAIVANAISRSLAVPACATMRFCPSVRAAACASLVSDLALELAGFTSKPIEVAVGTVSCSSSSCLATMNSLATRPRCTASAPQWLELQEAGRALGVDVIVAQARTPNDLAGAFQALADQRPDAVIVLQTSMLLSERRKIAELEAAARLPIVYGYREHVVDGGLISYEVDLRDCFRRSAVYVAKILHGTAPGDLPVQFPTKLELIINLKTAKALPMELRRRFSPAPTR